MKNMGVLAKSAAVVVACLGMLLPPPALQAAVADAGPEQAGYGPESPVADVALSEGGTLRGQVVGAQGKPVAGIAVSIRQLDRQIATTVSDRSGYFRVTGLRGGIYRVVAGKATRVYRLWAPGTAPPSARAGALVVPDNKQVLGQGHRRMSKFLHSPWLLGAIVAAAIAIPIAIHNSRSKS